MTTATIAALAAATALTLTPATTAEAPVYELDGQYEIIVDIGLAFDDEQNGMLIYSTEGAIDPEYDYISYAETEAEFGDVVMTVEVMTAGSEDDVIYRTDYIIDHWDSTQTVDYSLERFQQYSSERVAYYLEMLK